MQNELIAKKKKKKALKLLKMFWLTRAFDRGLIILKSLIKNNKV